MLLCGENPCAFFFHPSTKNLAVAISYWAITYSEHGCGNALFIGRPGDEHSTAELRCLTNNVILSNQIHSDFNRHFEIFRDFEISPQCTFANLTHTFDGRTCYEVNAICDVMKIRTSWSGLQSPEQTNVQINGFGSEAATKYSVYATIIACATASVAINGREEQVVLGERYGAFASSAFLSIAESWRDLGA